MVQSDWRRAVVVNLALVIAAGCGGDPAAGSGSSGDSSSSDSSDDSSSSDSGSDSSSVSGSDSVSSSDSGSDSSSVSGSDSVSSSDSGSGSDSAGACVSDLDCDPSQDTACAVARCNVDKGSCAIVPLGKGTMAMAAQGTLDGCGGKTGQCSHVAMPDGVVCGITSAGAPRSCLARVCTDAPGDMVLIPGGKAYQGCNAKLDADCAADEKPQRETDLPSFWIDRTEASRGAYQACVDVGTCPAIDSSSACNDNKSDNAPATCLSHAVASAYCTWRGARLPATATATYTWGEQGPLCTLTVKQSSKTGNAGCGSGGPFAPGSRAPDRSVYGVLDMGGNPLRARAESDRSTSRPAAPRAI